MTNTFETPGSEFGELPQGPEADIVPVGSPEVEGLRENSEVPEVDENERESIDNLIRTYESKYNNEIDPEKKELYRTLVETYKRMKDLQEEKQV